MKTKLPGSCSPALRPWNRLPCLFLLLARSGRARLCAVLAAVLLLAAAAPAGPGGPVYPDPPRRGTARPPARPADSTATQVRQLLGQQQSAWNRGDVDGFLAGYWNSEKTLFAGSQGITRGWQALNERYRKTYPDRRAMGTLAFSDLAVTPLCHDVAFTVGKWRLERESGPIGGVFSLVLRRFPQGWRIIADHTSLSPAGDTPAH